jgi:hypothetical protein
MAAPRLVFLFKLSGDEDLWHPKWRVGSPIVSSTRYFQLSQCNMYRKKAGFCKDHNDSNL